MPLFRTLLFLPIVVLLLLHTVESSAAPLRQVPVIGPDAITTPATTVLVPTPDATAKASTSDGAGYHEEEGEQRYVIQPGDTLWDVALETGIDLTTIPCAVAPDFQVTQPLVIGDELASPEPSVLCHKVAAGETVAALAALYRTTPAAIAAVPWNQLAGIDSNQPLPIGRSVRIPTLPFAGDGLADPAQAAGSPSFLNWMLNQPVDTSPFLALAVGGPFANQVARQQGLGRAVVDATQPGVIPKNWPYGSGNFTWPLAGWLTQGYRHDHRALDIAAPLGTIVTAADRGVVIRAGWNDQGYGRFVIIDHNIDYVTLYAHLNEIFVKEGQVVAQGERIGTVGSTGNSTGPHLHFEIRDFGRLSNPLELLVH
ncbi:MAG: peptidoglycan DD-metalloendopeptidase family protein [Caldilineaceae bacterium]